MFFKVYIKQVKDGKFIGEAALTGDYRNLKTAINAGKENLLTDESTFCVRKYDDTVAVNIMSNNINDTGNLVYVCKNYLEVAREYDASCKGRYRQGSGRDSKESVKSNEDSNRNGKNYHDSCCICYYRHVC